MERGGNRMLRKGLWKVTGRGREGRAIAQAASCRLPTAAARVRAQAMSRGIFGRQSDSEAGFLRVLRFPLSILIPPTVPHSSSIIQD
jgi:hypothetical protein